MNRCSLILSPYPCIQPQRHDLPLIEVQLFVCSHKDFVTFLNIWYTFKLTSRDVPLPIPPTVHRSTTEHSRILEVQLYCFLSKSITRCTMNLNKWRARLNPTTLLTLWTSYSHVYISTLVRHIVHTWPSYSSDVCHKERRMIIRKGVSSKQDWAHRITLTYIAPHGARRKMRCAAGICHHYGKL